MESRWTGGRQVWAGKVRSDWGTETGTLKGTSIGGESVFFCALCRGRGDGVQELGNCSALVSVRVAVLNIDHVDDKWRDAEEDGASETWTRFEER